MHALTGLLLFAAVASAQPPVTIRGPVALHYSGPQADKLDVVFLGDGYTELKLPHFRRKADEYMKAILACAPYSAYEGAFNFWRIDVVSAESGISNSHTGKHVNSFLNIIYDGDRRFDATDADELRIRDIAEAAGLKPDVLVVIANDSNYGGSGHGGFVVVSTNRRGQLIVNHELGHTFCTAPGGTHCLEDEYIDPGSDDDPMPESYFQRMGPNQVPPRCTPQSWCSVAGCTAGLSRLGCHLGGKGYGQNVYHSLNRKCKMQVLNRHFCPVCLPVIRGILGTYAATGTIVAPAQTSRVPKTRSISANLP